MGRKLKSFRPILIMSLLGGLAAGGIVAYRVGWLSDEATSQPVASNTNGGTSADAQLAANSEPAAASSYVRSDGPTFVKLRPCDHAPPDDASTHECDPIDELADSTNVTMLCWRDTSPPPSQEYAGKSPRWFYITEGDNGLHPGWTGWVYAPLVQDQAKVPLCDNSIFQAHPMANVKPLVLQVAGTCTTTAGELTAISSGFTPGGKYTVDITFLPSHWMYGRTEGIVSPDGSVPWRFSCAEGNGAIDTTVAGSIDLELAIEDAGTSRTIVDTFSVSIVPAAAPSNQPPNSSPSTHSQPVQQPPQQSVAQAPTRTITVYNKVTNGPTALQEDKTPAYLSTATHNFCRQNGCIVPDTYVSTGASLTATCQAQGDQTTNGNDHDAADDSNPGLYTSTLWYGVRLSDGRSGYISEVWIDPGSRGGLGLSSC